MPISHTQSALSSFNNLVVNKCIKFNYTQMFHLNYKNLLLNNLNFKGSKRSKHNLIANKAALLS